MKQQLQPLNPESQQGGRSGDGVLRGDDLRSPYFSTREACDYLRYTGTHRLRSLYRYLQRTGVRTARAGRKVLVLRADLVRSIGASRHTR